MIPAAVDYMRAASVEDALDALKREDAKVLAGGQSLLPAMKLRISRPALLVDIAELSLDTVLEKDGELVIGALATWASLEDNMLLQRPALRAFAECAAGIGDLQVRNRGTIGGSLAHADPASDMTAAVLALGATTRLRSADGERTVNAADFFLGPFTTAIGERELILDITVPVPPQGSGSAYVAVEHPASGFALAGAAVVVLPDGSRRVALTGVGAAAFLLDGEIDAAEIYGDRFAPEEYRRQLAGAVVRRAVEIAEGRAKEDETWTA